MDSVVNSISKFRTELMGVATLMILLGHSVFYGQGIVDYGLFQNIFTLGYCGVDIFLFLSGFGLIFSMKKNTKQEFYFHRFQRLWPSIFLIVCLNLIVNYKGLSYYMLNPLYWFGCYWYIGFIIVAYWLFPYLYQCLCKWTKALFWLSIVVSLILFVPFIVKGHAESNQYTCFITRIPIFVMGASIVMGGQIWMFSKKAMMVLGLVGLLTLIPFYIDDNLGGNKTMNTYYSFVLLTPVIIRGMLSFLNLNTSKVVLKILRWLGKYSLEVYLVQVTIMAPFIHYFNSHNFSVFVNLIFTFCIILFISVIMKQIADKFKLFFTNND